MQRDMTPNHEPLSSDFWTYAPATSMVAAPKSSETVRQAEP